MVKNFKPDPEVGAVVIGFDKDFSFPKIVKAVTYLNNPNVHFIGTNNDIERPSPSANKFPGWNLCLFILLYIIIFYVLYLF